MPLDLDDLRRLLCDLGDHIRAAIVAGRRDGVRFSAVDSRTIADTIYAVDRISDDALLAWFDARWPVDDPVELVSEGLDESVVAPTRATSEPRWTCIVDPVDGTRGLMYDKRSAWSLAAVAPRTSGRVPRLQDLVVAAMTELPPTKQELADQVSGVRGRGPTGLVAERTDLRSGRRKRLVVQPSSAISLEHGWASFARFFPQEKARIAEFEERLWAELLGAGRDDVAIFDDQYLATGGQIHELLVGHDRLLGDVRPLAARQAGRRTVLACHPYDCCTAFLLEEAGGVVTTPWGGPLDAPLDTTTSVAWVGYANRALADLVQPVVERVAAECFPAARPRSPG